MSTAVVTENARSTPPRSFAVMEDDSVLYADCVHEISDLEPARAETIVHAGIDAGPGVCCRWCAATEHDGGEG